MFLLIQFETKLIFRKDLAQFPVQSAQILRAHWYTYV